MLSFFIQSRYLLGDYNGNIINEISAQRQAALRQAANNYLQSINNVLKPNENKPPRSKDTDGAQPRKKREYRKRHRPDVVQRTEQEINEYALTSDDEDINDNQSHSISDQDEDDSDGPFSFKRKKGCQYHAPLSDPLGNWPHYSAEERVSDSLVKKYCLTELRQNNKRYFEYTRRRIGRGGRVIFDRIQFNSPFNAKELSEDDDNSNPSSFDYFRPKSPAAFKETDMEIDEDSANDLLYIENGNLNSSVPINLNDYLHENDDVYSDCRSRTDKDLANFKNHQKELIEMQKLQKEKLLLSNRKDSVESFPSGNLTNNLDLHQSATLNHNSEPLSEQTIKATVDLLSSTSMCNSNKFSSNQSSSSSITNHNSSSSIQINNSIASIQPPPPPPNTTSSLPQHHQSQKSSSIHDSTLDRESVSFAVSAVLSTVNSNSNSSTVQTSIPNNSFSSTNGPAQIEFKTDKSSYSNFSNQYSPSQINSSNANATSNLINSAATLNSNSMPNQQSPFNQQSAQQSNELTNSSNMFKIKFQTNNQNSITPTDVT